MSWETVMAKLTGARLAALDTLLRGGELSMLRIVDGCERHSLPEVMEAVDWLRAHHLVTEPAPGLFRAWSMAVAIGRYERAGGPIAEFMQGRRAMPTAAESRPAPAVLSAPAPFLSKYSDNFSQSNAAPSGVRVQDYQAQMFSDV